jgi:hypothetical protein
MNTIVAEEGADIVYDAKVTPIDRALRKVCQAINVLVHSSLYADEKKLELVFTSLDELFDLLSPMGADGKRMPPTKHPELAHLQKIFHIEMVELQDLIEEHKKVCKERGEPVDTVLINLGCRLRQVDSTLWT